MVVHMPRCTKNGGNVGWRGERRETECGFERMSMRQEVSSKIAWLIERLAGWGPEREAGRLGA